MDITLEGVVLDPYGTFDVTTLISESVVIDDAQLIQEASGTKKKNIFQKLFALMKKLCRFIKIKAQELMAAFTAIFKTRKVNDKTLDQIAEFVLGDTDKEPGNKHLQFRYDDDKRITINYIANTIKKFAKEPTVPGHARDDRPEQYAILLIFKCVKKPYLLDPVIEMLESMAANKGEIKFEAKRMQDAIDAIWANSIIGLGCSVSLEEWTALNDKIIKLNKAMEIIDDDSLGTISIGGEAGLSSKWAAIMNDLVRITSFLQKGINSIGDGMRQVYQLDSKYHDKINSKNFIQMLPKFVKMCVESNIPSKYIHYAIRQICDVSINSDLKDPTKKPEVPGLKGNGRFVIFPSDPEYKDKVIKVGYNGLGARGNRNEFVVWDKVKDIPEIASELYHIYDIGDPDKYVIMGDRCNPKENDKAEEWNKKMREACIKNNVGFIIRCNSGGFGEVDGKLVCVDYGNVHRIDR